jgi:hypothetical protein
MAIEDEESKTDFISEAPDTDQDYGYEDVSPDIAIKKSKKKPKSKGKRRKSLDSQTSQESVKSSSTCHFCPDDLLGQSRRSSMRQAGTSRRSSIQVTMHGSIKPVRRSKSISFNETVKVKRIASVHELTNESKELWFQDDEYDKIRKKSFKIADKFVQAEKMEGEKLCRRLLESIINHESRSLAKVDGWDAVLNEQHVQRRDGQFDDEHLSEVYQFSTRRSSNEAMVRAIKDQRDVENTRRICRRLTIA